MPVNGLTLADVAEAKQTLEARGEMPSGNKVLALIGHGSKSTLLKFLKVLADAPPAPVPQAAPPVSAPAPVQQARSVLDPVEQAEAHFLDARDALLQAKGVYRNTEDLRVNGIVHGSVHPHDPVHQEALADVDLAKAAYDEAWVALTEARAQQAQQQAAQQQAQREAWVQAHHPALVAELTRAAATYAAVQRLPETPDKAKAQNTAFWNRERARKAHNAALALAPTAINGSSH